MLFIVNHGATLRVLFFLFVVVGLDDFGELVLPCVNKLKMSSICAAQKVEPEHANDFLVKEYRKII